MFVVDCFGRKFLLVISGTGMLLGTVMLGTHFYITRPATCLNQTSVSMSNAHAEICQPHLAPLAIVSLVLFNAAFSIGWDAVAMQVASFPGSQTLGTRLLCPVVLWGVVQYTTDFYM